MSKVVKAKYTAEAVAGFTHRTAMEEAARCLLCHDAPCSKACPAGTDPKKASIALKRAVSEMDRRYDLFEEFGTKNISGYNALVEEKNKKLPDDEKLAKMPYIVVIVDELADLMLVAGKEVEEDIKITEKEIVLI